MRYLWLIPCSSLLVSCLGPADEGHKLGDDLGTFNVSAVQQSSTCGSGALGSQAKFKFDVDLSRQNTEFFWDKKGSGKVTSDGDFSVSVPVTFPISDPKPPDKGCTMYRVDTVDGSLEFSKATPDDVPSFKGTMEFDFAPGEGQSCSELIDVQGGFKTLPCSISYSLDGVRTREPDAPPDND